MVWALVSGAFTASTALLCWATAIAAGRAHAAAASAGLRAGDAAMAAQLAQERLQDAEDVYGS